MIYQRVLRRAAVIMFGHIGGKQMSENKTGLEARLRDMRALSLVM